MRFDIDPFTNFMIWVAVIAFAVYLLMTAFHYWVHWRYPGQVELALALKAMEKTDVMSSLVELNTAIEKNPQLWQAYLLRASVYNEMGQLEESKKDIDQFLAHNAENELTHSLRSLHFSLSHQPHEALHHAEAALKLAPNFPVGLQAKILALIELKRVDEAHLMAVEWAKKEPQEAGAHLLLGIVFQAKKNFEQAFHHFSDSLQLMPANFLVKVERARCLFALDRYTEMHADLKEVLAQAPDHLDALELHACWLNETGQSEKALELTEQLLKHKPDFADYWNLKGQIYGKFKDYHQQRDAFRRANELEPKNGMHLRNLGYSHARFRQYDKALELTQRGMALEPDSIAGKINLAHYQLCVGQVNEAQRLLDEVLALQPENPNALEEQGWVFYVQNRPEEAHACWERVEQIKASVNEDHDRTRAEIDELIQQGRFAHDRLPQ